MKVSFNWLKEFLDISLSPEELAQVFIKIGLEVDGLTKHGDLLKDIFTARIESIEKHPNADKLVITSVFDGTKHHQIVTGATNISVGDIVPLSVPGSVIASGMELKAAKLRGVDSFGMLCSETELGVSADAKGIWLLPKSTPLGVDFISYAQLKDTIFELAVLPNRSDCLSHYGIARELSAALNIALKPISTEVTYAAKTTHAIDIQTPLCSYYSLTQISGIKNQETPIWMKRRLECCGIRPINLSVDITNFVLLELGQPLHSFDAKTLTSPTITVRTALENEPFMPLDGNQRHLIPTDYVVSDGLNPIALAGVMGGKNSGVSDTTTAILLEAALFDPIATRRTANRLALRSESAIRFEKTVDPEGVERASRRAASLYQKLAGAEVVYEPIVAKYEEASAFTKLSLPFNSDKLNSILGTNYSEDFCKTTLERLGFKCEGTTIVVPSWRRHACTTQAALAEELARIGGFENIPSQLPVNGIIQEPENIYASHIAGSLQFFIHNGALQTSTFPMIAPEDINSCLLSEKNPVRISNPLTPEHSVMRPSLLPSLLKVASFNSARQAESIRYVEYGKSFHYDNQKIVETDCLAGLFSERRTELPFLAERKNSDVYTFFTIKGYAETILQLWGADAIFKAEQIPAYLHPHQSARIEVGTTIVGYVGTVHPSVTKAYGISDQSFYLELFTSLLATPSNLPKYRAIPKSPSTRRDIAFSISKNVPFESISSVIAAHKPALVRDWFLFDLFESEAIGADNKSLAFGFIYQDQDTLQDELVNQTHQAFCQTLQNTLPITIR